MKLSRKHSLEKRERLSLARCTAATASMFGKAEERSLKSEYFEPLTKVRLKRRTSALSAYASVSLKKRVLESQLAANILSAFYHFV